ncbi:hypothetical protein XELAEV_18001049mg [Xenopus laevis]|nr:hypothetical protein XELAEV_18001049mg [Xenopus laevis]
MCFWFVFNPAFVYKCPGERTPLLMTEQWESPPTRRDHAQSYKKNLPERAGYGESLLLGVNCLNFDMETVRCPERKDPLRNTLGNGAADKDVYP